MAGGRRFLATALGGIAAGAAGLAVVLGGIGTAEHVLVGGETQEWCEGTQGYDGNHGAVERCVRERRNSNVVAADEHLVELYRAESGGDRYDVHAWPLTGQDIDVTFDDDSVTVSDGHGVSATYPNSVFDDTR